MITTGKIIKTIVDSFPGMTREAAFRNLNLGIQHNKFDSPEQSPLYKIAKAFSSLSLESIPDRKTLISMLAVNSGLSKQYVSTFLSQKTIQVPEHLHYQSKSRAVVVQGIKPAAPRNKGKRLYLPVEKALRGRITEYAEKEGKSLIEVTGEALIYFLDSKDKRS